MSIDFGTEMIGEFGSDCAIQIDFHPKLGIKVFMGLNPSIAFLSIY